MKKTIFKLCCMILITSYSIYGQEKSTFSERFNTNVETTMIINLANSHVLIEPSTDGKVSVNYNFEFEGFTKEEIKNRLERINVKATTFENSITIRANEVPKNHSYYAYNGKGSLFIDDDVFGMSKKTDSIVKKSKDSILSELRFSRLNATSFADDKFKVKQTDGSIVSLADISKAKIVRGHFSIKVPPYVKLHINGKDAYVNFNGDVTNELYVTLNKGGLNAEKLMNRYNKIKVADASFRVEQVLGGNYSFNNVKNGVIAALGDVTIISEFSKMELGEIAKGTYIMDFNSEYWFYNYTRDFERFYIRSEYSKIHFFYPNFDHSFKVFGHNTVNHIGDMKIEMQPNKKGEKFNMMEKKAKSKKTSSGHIDFDIVHGIIYSHNDSIKTINK